MKIVIEPTGHFTTISGVECRRWTGKTECGETCHVYAAGFLIEDKASSSAIEGMASLYEAGGHGWDDVADPEAVIRESRGD